MNWGGGHRSAHGNSLPVILKQAEVKVCAGTLAPGSREGCVSRPGGDTLSVRYVQGEQQARLTDSTASLTALARLESASPTAGSDDCSDRPRLAVLTATQRPRRGEKISVG